MPSADVEVFAALGRAFGRLGVRWYVFGAQAAILYGASRLTEDVDVTVDPGGHETSELVGALASEGFSLRVDDVDGFVARTRVLPLVHEPSDMPVDVVLAGPGLEDLFFEGARVETIEGVSVPVASREDIVTMKLLAGRPKDLEDAAAIFAVAGDDVDLERIRSTLRLLEQALDQSDLLPRLDELVARSR